ncbi:MAG: hypothetical protein ABSD08_16010 [Xanthobacteraceae bacterium]|jgi:hypothetical protein
MPNIPTVATPGILKLLAQILSLIGEGRKKHLRSLSALINKKFRELDRSHKLFIRLLGQLHDHIAVAENSLNKTDDIDAMVKEIKLTMTKIYRIRSEGRERRRAEYEEARVYADNIVSDRSIFTRTPEDVALKIQDFMSAYCTYFSRERTYEHELHLVLELVERTIRIIFDSLQNDGSAKIDEKQALKIGLEKSLSEIQTSLSTSRERWALVARAYHLLGQSFREHGLIE